MFAYAAYESQLPALKSRYEKAEEFPHIMLEHFLEPATAAQAAAAFPAMQDEGWIHYIHFNEKKGGLNKREYIPPALAAIIDELNSPQFVDFLRKLTGIPNLIPDPTLEGGGLHQIARGGFLNIHADFTTHPHQRLWRRRVNLLLYLNDEWQEEYGGHLELWTKDMRHCFEKILPVANRCVIFNTERDAFHGHPLPLTCPETTTRKSIALYYYTEEKAPPLKIATNYQARPEDGYKALFIYLDKKALSLYNRLKGVLGINDDFASSILKTLSNFFKRR